VKHQPDESFTERLIQDAFTDASGGLDVTTGRKCLRSLGVALLKQCERLEAADYSKAPPGEVAKANHYTVKTADVLFRLIQFSQGDPDSRPELVGGGNWLEALTSEQLKQVKGWLRQNLEAGRDRAPTAEPGAGGVPPLGPALHLRQREAADEG
jgi:hypothetical protein